MTLIAGASGQLNAAFGRGTGSIWLDGVNCNGTEKRLIECASNTPTGNHNCDHSDDAGVICYHSMQFNSYALLKQNNIPFMVA